MYAHKQAKMGVCAAQYAELENWYEAVRLLLNSWGEAEDAAVSLLRMLGTSSGNNVGATTTGVTWPAEVNAQLIEFWRAAPASFPRFEHLRDILLDDYHRAGRPGEFRGLLFVEQRVMTHIIADVISQDAELSQLFSPACLYAASSPATPSLRLSPTESKTRVSAFASGQVNLLISTAVAEEGMDIPSANCVLCFDPNIHGVAFVQRRGRARQEDSSYYIMNERPDRPTSRLAASEEELRAFMVDFTPSSSTSSDEKSRAAQKARERTANPLLAKDIDSETVLGTLQQYCQKTKAPLQEHFTKSGVGFTCKVKYESVLRDIEGEASGPDKKRSKQLAAVTLWGRMKDAIMST
jgi:hypothetical protein